MKNILENDKMRFFALGIVATIAILNFFKSMIFKSGCIKLIASGMKIRKDALATLEKMKEDAEDICCDAEEVEEEPSEG